MPSNTSDDAIIEERRSRAWTLRLKGKSVRQIAAALGVGVATAHSDLKTVLERTKADNDQAAEDHRSVSIARLDRALDTIEDALEAVDVRTDDNGDIIERGVDHELRLKALDRLLKLEERRAKLLGLDAPVKTEVEASVTNVASPAEAARLVRTAFGEHASKKESDESESAPVSGEPSTS
jgi:hypothetical protein